MSVDTTTTTDVQPVPVGPLPDVNPIAAPSQSGVAGQPGCCPPVHQETCCDTSAKADCCGDSHGGDTSQGCGCR